ncbi:MAG: hypothetical protein RLZZ248_71 [Bacteroidota bacterium]
MEELVFIDWKSDVGFKWLFARDTVAEHLVAFLRDLTEEVEAKMQVQEKVRELSSEEEDISEENQEDEGLRQRVNVLGLGSILGGEMGRNFPDEKVSDGIKLAYHNVELITREEEETIRKILFDVYVALPGGNRVIIEMQKAPHKGLDLRMLKYLIRGIESSGGVSHVFIALMNFKFSGFWGTSPEDSVVKVYRFDEGALVTVELGWFDKPLEELDTGLDRWLFLFKNITKLKSVPEVFRGTIFEKMMDMSRIKTLPKEQSEDWKKELDNNRYVQEGIQILAKQAEVEMAAEMASKMAAEMAAEMASEKVADAVERVKAEVKAEAVEKEIMAYQKGEQEGMQEGAFNQLKATIAKMKSKGMTEEQIKYLLDLDELPTIDGV